MREWSSDGWRQEWEDKPGPFGVFVHTPLCGTCGAVRRMLAVAAELVPEFPLAQANLNLMPAMAQHLQIESVPCLLIKHGDGTWIKHYKFPSVMVLVERLRGERQKS